MNTVSASALDLLASALAAIILLYIATLQEILIHPKSVEQKAALIQLRIEPKTSCTLGTFFLESSTAIFPREKSEDISILPQKIGSLSYTIKVKTSAQKQFKGKLIIFLHECKNKINGLPIQENQNLEINVLGPLLLPIKKLTLSQYNPMMVLDLQKLHLSSKQYWYIYQS